MIRTKFHFNIKTGLYLLIGTIMIFSCGDGTNGEHSKNVTYNEYDTMLVNGYLRNQEETLGEEVIVPQVIRNICLDYYSNNIRWRIPVEEFKAGLHKDFTTINGQFVTIDGNEFRLKLKRSRNNLYFGVWYQGTNEIDSYLKDYFACKYDKDVADVISESFKYIVKEEEFDDIQLILHDFEDLTYSCLLEHIEEQLRDTFPSDKYKLKLKDNDINSIKQDIKSIVKQFGIENQNQNIKIGGLYRKICFGVHLMYKEVSTEFNRYYEFNKNEVAEKPAEWNWRNQWNDYKDSSLSFSYFLEEIAKNGYTYLTFIANIHPYLNNNDGDLGSSDETSLSDFDEESSEDSFVLVGPNPTTKYYYEIEKKDFPQILNMKHGDHIYIYNDRDKVRDIARSIALCFGYYYGNYHLLVTAMSPYHSKKLSNESFKVYLDNTEVKRFSSTMEGELICKIDFLRRMLENSNDNINFFLFFEN